MNLHHGGRLAWGAREIMRRGLKGRLDVAQLRQRAAACPLIPAGDASLRALAHYGRNLRLENAEQKAQDVQALLSNTVDGPEPTLPYPSRVEDMTASSPLERLAASLAVAVHAPPCSTA